MNLTFSWNDDACDPAGASGKVVSLVEFRARQPGPRRVPDDFGPIRPVATGLTSRQAAHRRRMLRHLGGGVASRG